MPAEINQDFVTYQGDAVAPVFTVRDADGTVVDISTVSEITWSARRNLDTAAVLTKTRSGGAITFVTNGTNGQFQVAIATGDTSAMAGFYVHQAKITDSTGNVTTVTVGRMQIGLPPAWTYDPTQIASSSLYQVRRLIGDIFSGEQLMVDEEINFAIGLYPSSVYLAAAECCRQLSAGFARQVDIVQGELKTNHSQKSKRYAELAVDMQSRGMARGGVMPYVGGISVTDKNAVAADPDRVAPAFNIGMDDNLTSPGPYPNETPAATSSGAEDI